MNRKLTTIRPPGAQAKAPARPRLILSRCEGTGNQHNKKQNQKNHLHRNLYKTRPQAVILHQPVMGAAISRARKQFLPVMVAVKIGGFILKLLLGLAAIALVWWFVAKMIH